MEKIDQYKTNQLLTINDKFLLIENHFMVLSNTPKRKMFKLNSHLNLLKRPALKKKKIFIDKMNIRNPLDQIGNDDLIFNNDKLITNMKIDSLGELSKEEDNINKARNSPSIPIRALNRKVSLTPVHEKRKIVNIKKIDLNKNDKDSNHNDSLQLNSIKATNNKKINIKGNKIGRNKKNFIQSYRMKNINQFINKPNEEENISNQKKLLMTPSNTRVKRKMQSSFPRFNKLKLDIRENNDNTSLASTSKIGGRSSARGRSVPSSLKNKSNMHFPNKSTIKNKDKLYKELQKIFGENIILNDELYQNMAENDKKNCINFLLDAIKEMFNINKILENKYDGFKEINEAKEKQIKENKNEIKELKKDVIKLNKIIKTNIQMNRKLSQNVDNLKLQLEKEKNKNKECQTRGKSSSRNVNNFKRNDISEFSITTTTRRNRYKSQDRLRDTNEFINRKKRIDFNQSKEKNKNGKNLIKINGIKIQEKNSNSNTINNDSEQSQNKNKENGVDENIYEKKTIDNMNNKLTNIIFNED